MKLPRLRMTVRAWMMSVAILRARREGPFKLQVRDSFFRHASDINANILLGHQAWGRISQVENRQISERAKS